MGFSTTYLGRLDIDPPLNDAEAEWLRAFAAIDRRHYSEPYEVAMNPRALAQAADQGGPSSRRESPDPFTSLSPPDGTPYPHLDWAPCPVGCCLEWDGSDKSRAAEHWLAYLIDHFLRPDALASRAGGPDFDAFSFDHVVNGTIAACRDDTRELSLIQCIDNELSVLQLVAPDPMPWD